MKLYHNGSEIFYAVFEEDENKYNIELQDLSILEIDEIKENLSLCRDLFLQVGRFNINGQGKYYIENGNLFTIDEWIAL